MTPEGRRSIAQLQLVWLRTSWAFRMAWWSVKSFRSTLRLFWYDLAHPGNFTRWYIIKYRVLPKASRKRWLDKLTKNAQKEKSLNIIKSPFPLCVGKKTHAARFKKRCYFLKDNMCSFYIKHFLHNMAAANKKN
jgi:hypothetical protein